MLENYAFSESLHDGPDHLALLGKDNGHIWLMLALIPEPPKITLDEGHFLAGLFCHPGTIGIPVLEGWEVRSETHLDIFISFETEAVGNPCLLVVIPSGKWEWVDFHLGAGGPRLARWEE